MTGLVVKVLGQTSDGSGFYLCVLSFYLAVLKVEDVSCEVAQKKGSV